MSNDELQELIRQQRELALRITELQDRQREEVVAQEQNKPITLRVTRVENEMVYVTSDYRADLVELQRKLPTRFWHAMTKENSFNLHYWVENLEKMLALPNITIEYPNGAKEKIELEINKPDFEIATSPDDKFLYVKVGRADATQVSTIPGTQWDLKNVRYLVPIVEGWRLFENLQKRPKVLWSDHALKLVSEDMDRRNKLDEIALRENASFHIKLNGLDFRPFQNVGVEFCEAAGGRIILADQMGLGKTWQAIGYAERKSLRTLVVCPASLRANWAREIVRLTNQTPTIHTGSTPGLWDMKALVGEQKALYHIINYDILGKKIETSDESPSEGDPQVMLKKNIRERWLWVDLINMSNFDLVVLDESHYIKNTNSNRSKGARLLNASRIMCMTGTPVLNRPGELWPMLTLLYPEKFPSEDTFLTQYTINGTLARNVEELRSLLKPIMIRRLKKDVEKELPPINRIQRWTELSDRAKKLSNMVLAGIYQTLSEWDPSDPGAEKIVPNLLVKIMRLKQIASVDRIDFIADLAIEVNDSIEERNGGDGTLHDKTHKVLIFSQFVPITHAIANRLGNEAVWITGELNANKRDEVLLKFKTDPAIRFLVATDRVASEGLNLFEAHAVIFADLLWTPAAHEQCEGRAYGRLADMHGIDSYWCAATDSIDEHILKILDRKMNVINQVVEGMEAERGTSVVKELLQVLKDEMGRKRRSA